MCSPVRPWKTGLLVQHHIFGLQVPIDHLETVWRARAESGEGVAARA